MIPLKDQFFNVDLLIRLNEGLKSSGQAGLDSKGILKKYEELELLDRMHLTADEVFSSYDQSFPDALQHILDLGSKFKGFGAMVFPDIIERFGINYPELSLPALAELTANSSSEFAIRPFIKEDMEGTLRVMEKWSISPNHHIRRLASEGSRYKLPWSFKIQEFIEEPILTAKIIANLNKDDELYVRKSVANHLNDLSKEKSAYVLDVLSTWGEHKHSDWIKKHALRSLIKKGDKGALRLMGVKPVSVAIKNLQIKTPIVQLGSELEMELAISCDPESELNVDYAIHFMKANGQLSKKVFKLSKFKMGEAGEKTLKKKHRIEQLSTRKIYAGRHGLSFIVNGEETQVLDFDVIF